MSKERNQDHDRLRRMISLSQNSEDVWAAIGGFDKMADWHPLIASVEIVDADDATHRHLTTTDGEVFYEKLLEIGPQHITYEILDGPLPVTDYRATLSCVAEPGGCHVFWSAYFIPNDQAEQISDDIVAKFYEIGLRALQDRFQ